jgi:hypothetical protein
VSDQVWHPYKTQGKIIATQILIFQFLDSKLEDKIFCTEIQQAFPDNPIYINEQVSHPYKTQGKIIVMQTLIFKFLVSQVEDKIFCTE